VLLVPLVVVGGNGVDAPVEKDAELAVEATAAPAAISGVVGGPISNPASFRVWAAAGRGKIKIKARATIVSNRTTDVRAFL